MKSKSQLMIYCIDYTPYVLYEKINVKNITEWAQFLFENDIFEMKDIYTYLDNKIKDL
jgi:hypothetical protein